MDCSFALVTIFAFLLVEPTSAGFLSRFFKDPSWDTLRVTWGINVASDHVFTKMPLKVKKAGEKGYIKEKLTASCSGKFLGERYIRPDNPGVAVLYDHNGYFAGIQVYFPKPTTTKTELPSVFQKSPLFIEDQISGNSSYVLTAYLVDPTIICTTGRTKEDYDKQKVGNTLYIQNGPNPLKDLLTVPLYENETISNNWLKGSCFASMGLHYWYNISKDMSCDNLLPLFLTYNHGKLTGFGWAFQEVVSSSSQFEHPSKDNLDRYFDSTPRCIKDLYTRGSGLTTVHIYMNAKPWNLLC